MDPLSTKNFSNKSFTIVELLIAMGVFMFLMIATFGIYTVAIQRHYDAQKSQIVNQELRYAMEVISRDIKDSFVKSSSSSVNEYSIYLLNRELGDGYLGCVNNVTSDCLEYNINSSTNPDGTPTTNNGIWAENGRDDPAPVRLTSENVQILPNSKFVVDATPFDSQDNPKVTIFIDAKEKNDTKDISEIFLQTTVTQKDVKKNLFTL